LLGGTALEALERWMLLRERAYGIALKVRAKVSNVERRRSKEIELIADTGAIYTAIPEDILKDLGIVARGMRRFKTASGELKELPVGEAYIEIAGEGVTSIVAFPITGVLRPMEFFLLGLEI